MKNKNETNYLNFEDLNYIENEIETLTNKVKKFSTIPVYNKKNWVVDELPFIQEIQRIETGVENLGEYTIKPTGWIETRLWIDDLIEFPLKTFSYIDYNRWLKDIKIITELLATKFTLSIKGDISLLYGNDGKQYGEPKYFSNNEYFSNDLVLSTGVPYANILYPSKDLYGKNMNLVIETTNNKKIIPLPMTYLNYIDDTVCDEFKIENNKIFIIRRVGIDKTMKKYKLKKEVIEDLGKTFLTLEKNSKVYLECFPNAKVKYDIIRERR